MNHSVRKAIRQYLFEPRVERMRRSRVFGDEGSQRVRGDRERTMALRLARAA